MEFHDPIESCPYNVTHRIRRSRMQFHVTTCAQNHPNNHGLLQCPFDARHVIKRVEFEHHKKTCPARALVLDYAIHDVASQKKLKILPIETKLAGKWTEKWDDDPDVKTYDPIQHIKNKPIVYPLIGVSKAKRKDHRLQERMRYQRIMQNGGEDTWRNQFYSRPMSTSSNTVVNTTVEVVYEIGDDTDEGNKPLRPPLNCPVNGLDKTFSRDSRPSSECSMPMDPEILSTSSKVDRSPNYSSTSYESHAASLSSNQPTHFLKSSADDCWIFDNSPRTANAATVDKKVQEKFIPDTDSIVFSKDNYQFDQYKDQEKNSVSDKQSIISSEDDNQIRAQSADMSSLPLTQDTSDTGSEFTYIEDNAAIEILSKTDEEMIKNDKNYEELPLSDKIYDVPIENENHYIEILMHGCANASPLSSESGKTSHSSLSYKTAHSNTISVEAKPVEDDLVLEKLTKTVNEMTVNDKNYQNMTEFFNQQLDNSNKLSSTTKPRVINASVDYMNKGKLFRRCAANFLNLKQ